MNSRRSIEDLLQTMKRDTAILGDVQRHVLRLARQENTSRAWDMMHPSDMAKTRWCPRAAYYQITSGQHDPTSTTFATENMFQAGHDIHSKWQGWLADMGRLYGNWACTQCGYRWCGLVDDDPCCHGSPVYKEFAFDDMQLRIQGKTDGVLLYPDTPAKLLEIKSIGVGTLRFEAPGLHDALQAGEKSLDQVWMAVGRPFPSHLRQAMIYLWLAKSCSDPVVNEVDEIVFIYEWKPTQAVKEFVVKYDESVIADRIQGAKDVVFALNGGELPFQPMWADEETTCKSCTYRDTCWGTNVATTVTQPRRIRRAASTTRRRTLSS